VTPYNGISEGAHEIAASFKTRKLCPFTQPKTTTKQQQNNNNNKQKKLIQNG